MNLATFRGQLEKSGASFGEATKSQERAED